MLFRIPYPVGLYESCKFFKITAVFFACTQLKTALEDGNLGRILEGYFGKCKN